MSAPVEEPRAPAPALPERRRRRDRVDLSFAVTLALGVGGGLLLSALVAGVLSRLLGLLVLLVVSLFLSFGMEPAVQWLSRRGLRRGFGTMLVFLAAFVLFGAFVAAMAQLVIEQVVALVQAGPDVLTDLAAQVESLPGGESLSAWLAQQQAELPRRIPGMVDQFGQGVLGVGTTLAGGVFQLLTTLLVTFYLVADGPRLRRALVARIEPRRQREFLQVWELAIAKTGGYVYSRVLTAVASAVVHVVAFSLLDVPYAIALGVWVGIVSSLIPVIGTYLAGALPALIALAISPWTALWVVVTIFLYQQLENYLIAPRITAHTMELHPAVAFVAVLAGGALLGAPGALLALPAAAIVAALVSAYGERHEVMEHGLVSDPQREPAAHS